MKTRFIFLILVICSISCEDLFTPKDSIVVAKIEDNFLTRSQIALVGKGLDSRDSLMKVSEYIRHWAKKKLMFEQAKKNIPESKIQEFEKLVAKYKRNLYSQFYVSIISNNFKDTLVTKDDYESLYNSREFNFRLQEDIIKVRYMVVKKYTSKSLKKNLLKKFELIDTNEYKHYGFENSRHVSYFLNDSTWIRLKDLKKIFKTLKKSLIKESIEKGIVKQIKNHKDLVFFKFLQLKNKNEITPMGYIKPTLKLIIINKRKKAYITQLENDLVNQAIQKNTLEIYE